MTAGATCASPLVDPDVFFQADTTSHPGLTPKQRQVLNSQRRRIADRLCGHCPVRQQCLDENLLQPYGIFGGLGEHARRVVAAERGLEWPTEQLRIDEVAVQQTMDGPDRPPLTHNERAVAVLRLRRQLAGIGHGRHQVPEGVNQAIGERVGIHPDTVCRILKRVGTDERFLSA